MKRQLGSHSPMAMINALWLNNTTHFGLRGVEKHRKLTWGDIQLQEDTDGTEYLEYNKRDTKTRRGKYGQFKSNMLSKIRHYVQMQKSSFGFLSTSHIYPI